MCYVRVVNNKKSIQRTRDTRLWGKNMRAHVSLIFLRLLSNVFNHARMCLWISTYALLGINIMYCI